MAGFQTVSKMLLYFERSNFDMDFGDSIEHSHFGTINNYEDPMVKSLCPMLRTIGSSGASPLCRLLLSLTLFHETICPLTAGSLPLRQEVNLCGS
jgi:hypothetical protein